MDFVNLFAKQGLSNILLGLASLFLCLLASRLLLKVFSKALKHMPHVDPVLHSMLRTVLRCLLYVLSGMVAAGTMGISITSFLALFSVIGLAVSLAVQGVLSNLAGGIIILASKLFTLGDYIESDSVAGTVQEIGFLHTRLLSFDGKIIYVPNSTLHVSRLINHNASGSRRIDLPISAAYEHSPDEVRAAIMQVIQATPAVLQSPEPQVLLDSYGESSIHYIVRVWTSADDFWPTRYALNEAIYNSFVRNHLHMTYPHVNVHMQP